jgi:hypothetical protein
MWAIILLLAMGLGLLLLVVAVAAVVTIITVAKHAVPLLLILIGAWLLMRAIRGPAERGEARAGRRPRPQPATPAPRSAPPRPTQQRPPARRPEASPRRELPIDVQVKVEQIQRKADLLLGYADRFPPFSQDLYIVRQTAADYLPRTVHAYLSVPGHGDPVVRATGRTALEELKDQLQLLDSRLDDIAEDLQRRDLDRLVENRRFLEERFGMREPASSADPTDQSVEAIPKIHPLRSA